MALQYSFYGGRAGASYRLVEHFDSIKDMVDAFQQGGSYNTVNYGEYVIIDTIVNNNHYNSPENGIIYRRGLNYTEAFNPNSLNVNSDYTIAKEDTDSSGKKRYYTYTTDTDENTNEEFDTDAFRLAFSEFALNPGGGAEYVGQIVGPQGAATELSLVKWDDFLTAYETYDGKKASLTTTPTAAAAFDSDGNVKESEIIDTIKYGYVNVRDEDGNITGAYISVDIPSSVFSIHAESIEPYAEGYAVYDTNKNIWTYTNLISEDDISKSHPYYWQYGIKVPKGIKGQDLEKVGLEVTGATLNDGDDIDNSDNNYQYYYITRNYDKTAEGETTKTFIDGSYNRTIHKITNNGVNVNTYNAVTRRTTYGQGQKVTADGLVNGLCLLCIQGGITGSDTLTGLESKTTVSGNNTVQDGTVVWQVIDDEITPPDLLTIHYTHGDNDTIGIRVVDDIIYNEDEGRFYVKYSDVDSEYYLGTAAGILRVDYIDTPWTDANGVSHTVDKIRIVYNTYKYDSDGNKVVDDEFSIDANNNEIYPTTDSDGRNIQWIDEQFKFIDRVEIDDDTKQVTVYYNDGTTTPLGLMRTIQDVYISNEGSLGSSKYLTVRYNNKINGEYEEDRFDSLPLNEIVSVQQYGDNLIVLYSDPDVRKNLYAKYPGSVYKIKNDNYTLPLYDGTTGSDEDGYLYWYNLGAIYKGNHVFSHFDSVEQLKSEYPYGLEKDTSGNLVDSQAAQAGWIVTVADESGQISTYAYDYRLDSEGKEKGWYELQNLEAQSISPNWTMVVSVPKDGSDSIPPDEVNTQLNVNGYWFVVSTRDD